MAISKSYVRPNDMKTDAWAFSVQRIGTHTEQIITVNATVPAAATLTAFTAADSSYTDSDSGDTIRCSGIISAIGESYGILMEDAKVADEGQYALFMDEVLLALQSGSTPVIGDIAYVNTTTGEIRDDGTGGKRVGTFTRTDTVTSDPNLPSGLTFCYVKFDGTLAT